MALYNVLTEFGAISALYTKIQDSTFHCEEPVFSDKSLSEKNRIHHAPLASVNSFSYDTNKIPRRKAKKFRPIEDDPSSRASISSVRRALGELALGILEHSYNPFMKSVRGRLLHDSDSGFEDHYDTYYLWAIQFFMAFNRLYSFRLDFVRETLDVSIFTYLVKQVYCYQESMILVKDDSEKWGRRLHRCVSALRELLNYLQAMQCSEQYVYRENARILQTNIFYMSEFREMFPSLLREYKPAIQSRSYLATLMDSLHLFLRLLEKFTQGSSLMVQVKGKAKKKKVHKKKICIDEPTREQLEIEWDKMQYELLRILESESGEIDQLEIEGLFDATRQDQEEEQKHEALSRTQACLRRGDMERAIATLRAAREIWPSDDFGPRDSTCIDELKRLQDIYLRPIISHSAVSEALLDDEEFEEDDSVPEQRKEGEFDLFMYSLKFCHQKIISTFCFLLSQYSFNTDFTNHALVKMLHRICYKCKKFPLLYQISIFSVFQFILEESNTSRYKELKLFAIHVLKRFFSAVRQNPCLFVEILFWKSQNDCVDIELGYGTVASMRDNKVSQRLWSEEDTNQLTSLWQQYRGCDRALSEIAAEMTSKTEQQIKKKLISSGIAEKTDFAKQKSRRKREWSEEEEERLRELYSVYGEQEGTIQSIASHFPGRSEKEVTTIMKKLGIGRVKTTEELPSNSKPNRIKKKKHKSGRAHPLAGNISNSVRETNNRINLRKAIPLYESAHADERLLPGLKWLDKTLRVEAVDRETDPGWDAVPLVPDNLELGRALESEIFQDLLRALSLTEPDTGQMFWRIPSGITPKDLIACADLLSGKIPDIQNEFVTAEPLEKVLGSESAESLSELSEFGNSSDSSQLSAENPLTPPTIQNTNYVKQNRPGLANLLERKRSTATKKINTFKSKEFLSDSDFSEEDLITNNQVESVDDILVPSPPLSRMKQSVKRLYNSDSGSDTAGDRLENSQPLHSKLQRLCAHLSEDSDEEPDHLLRDEDTGGGRGKRARLDSEDSEEGVSCQNEERYNLKKVRYIQESDDD